MSVGQSRVWKKPGPNVCLSLCGERECVYSVRGCVCAYALVVVSLSLSGKSRVLMYVCLCVERGSVFFFIR